MTDTVSASMKIAGAKAAEGFGVILSFEQTAAIYRAMLAASPQGEGSSADADTHRATADGCFSLDETALQRIGEEASYSTNVRAFGLYDYSSYPAVDGGLKPHVVRDELARGKVVFESDDPAEARAEYIRLCHVFIGRRAVEIAATASSVGMSEANAPYRVTEGVKP